MTTRIALIGAGSVARRHASVLMSLQDVKIVAVADPSEAAADKLAQQCGARSFRDIEDALDSKDADAVYVCVPPFAHGALEKVVLARELPMFVEKPLAVDLATAEGIAARVEQAGVVTGTGYHWRCLDVVNEARDLLRHAAPRLACGYWLDKEPTAPWWAQRHRSGGPVIEQLTHVVDLARVFLGDAVDVYAAGSPRQKARGETTEASAHVDDATAATVCFASGAVATLATTSVLDVKHRAELHVFGRGIVVELSESGMVVTRGTTRHHRQPAEDPRVTVDREFIEAVRGEREATRAPYAEMIHTHRLACAVAESARTRQPVRIPTVTRGTSLQ
jgi:predicted dehydrogenase